jgi:hypothetical protein
MVKEFGISTEDALAKAIEDSREELQESIKTRVKDLRLQVEVMTIQSTVLPDEPILAKIFRYETHLSQQMIRALHELQCLQAARKQAKTKGQ